MRHGLKFAALFLIVALASLWAAVPALALIPPLPSSFYGAVKVNGQNVPDGTTIKALIKGQVFATGYTQTYEGNSVYSIDIPGDDPSTPALEGGLAGDAIQFMVGEVAANETGTWTSAVNVNLNLTASASTPLNTPQPTPTPVPTQTAIQPPKRNPTATAVPTQPPPTEAVTLPTLTSEPPPAATQPGSEIEPQPTQSDGGVADENPVSTPSLPANGDQPSVPEATRSSSFLFLIVVIVFLIFIAVWIVRALFRSKER